MRGVQFGNAFGRVTAGHAMLFLSLFLLTACGGGGGGGGAAPAVSPTTPPTMLDAASFDEARTGQVAGNEPTRGSVTQGSDGAASAGETTATVSIDCSPDSCSSVDIAPSATTTLEISLANPNAIVLEGDPDDDFEDPFNFDHPQNAGGEVFELIEAERLPDSNDAAAFTLFVSDYRTANGGDPGGDDYLAFGVWAYDTDATTTASYEVGVFADGVEFIADDLPTGITATYTGKTVGVYARRSTARGEEFGELVGDVALTATFDDTPTIEGTVDNIHLRDGGEGQFEHETGATITLVQAEIDANTKFFKGDTSAIVQLTESGDPQTGTGHWGGQFFGTADARGAPTRVGGTWGVEVGDSTDTITAIGAYGAWPTPTPAP